MTIRIGTKEISGEGIGVCFSADIFFTSFSIKIKKPPVYEGLN
jgi:hypothetical protein